MFILIPAINKERVIYFPFGSVENGDYFCFDLENNWVVIYIHELQKFRYVCDSFEELLGMMDQNERNEF